MNDLLNNLHLIHTTPLGVDRIRQNLNLADDIDVVKYCVDIIQKNNCEIIKQGKNWYAKSGDEIITVNSYSYTIITAKKAQSKNRRK